MVTVDHPKVSMDKRILGLSTLLLLTVWSAPTRIKHVDFRSIQKPAVIYFERNSPAFAALEDSRMDWSQPIVAANDVSMPVQRLKLLGRFRFPRVVVPALSLRPLEISNKVKTDHLASLILEHATEVSPINDPMEPLTVSAYGEILVKEELARRDKSASKMVRTLATESGKEIIVAKPNLMASLPSKVTKVAKTANSNSVVAASTVRRTIPNRKIQWPVLAQNKIGADQTGEMTRSHLPAPVLTSSGLMPSQPLRYRLSGNLTLSGGAAWLGGQDFIRVLHVVDELSVNEGYVDYKNGNFDIAINDFVGEVRAVATNAQGQMIAAGKINLLDIKPNNVAHIKGQALDMHPVFNGVRGQVVSSIQVGDKPLLIQGARLRALDLEREIIQNKKTMLFEDANIQMPSQMLMSAQQEKHWSTLAMVSAGRDFQIRMFTHKFLEALLELTLDKYEARSAKEQAIVWGRVSMMGRPLLGAKVRIVGEDDKNPVYINGYLPDKTKTSTTTKGEFAFTQVEPEEKLLQISIGTRDLWPVMVPAVAKHVSYSELEVQRPETKIFKTFDAFSNAPVAAFINPLGTEEQIFTGEQGEASVELQKVSGLTLLESVTESGYMPMRVGMDSHQTEIHFPLVKSEWLKDQPLLQGLSHPSVVGFVSGNDFEVLIGSGDDNKKVKIIYFDAAGRLLKDSEGGRTGYLIFNLDRGLHTITIIPEKAKQVVTQVIYADEFAAQGVITNLMF